MPNQIFISYRRSDAGGHAGRLHDRLVDCFEPEVLFYDLESIDGGEAFPARLTEAVGAACVVLVLIGPDWLTELTRRAALPDTDYVKREVELALQRHASGGAPLVVPVLLGGALPPPAASLPAELCALASLNVVVFQGNNADWNAKFGQLLQLLGSVPGVPEPQPPAAARRRWPFVAAALAAVIAGGGLWAALQARPAMAKAAEDLRIGRYDLAAARMAAVPALARWWPTLGFARSKAELGLGLMADKPDWERFNTDLNLLLLKAPADNELLVLQATREIGEGRYEEAGKTAARVTVADPRHAQAWFVLGTVHDYRATVDDDAAELKQAEAAYRKAADLASGSPHYRNNLAHTLLQGKRYDEAIATYQHIKSYPLAPLEQAKAHWARGEFGLAAERQQDAIKLLGIAEVAKESVNLPSWDFYTTTLRVSLATPDKLCYAQWSRAASLRLAVAGAGNYPPAECPQPTCAVRQVIAFDLQTYPPLDAAVQETVKLLRRPLGDTARCVAAASEPPAPAPAVARP